MNENASDVMTPRETAAYARTSESTLAKLRLYGGGPKFLKLTRKVLYRRADVDAWMKSKEHASTSEYVGAR